MISMAEVAKEIYLRVDQEAEAGVPPLTKSGALEIVKAIFDVIGQAVVAGESVAIPKFGKFASLVKPARKARNPKTGKSIDIPEKMAVKFRPSSVLRLALAEAEVVKKEEKKPKKAKKEVKPAKKASAKKKK